MKAKNMRVNDPPQDGRHHVEILPLGFESMDMERLKRIFENAPQGIRTYGITHPLESGRFDILLVNYDNPVALSEKSALIGVASSTPVVAVSRGPLNEAPIYHLRGMLIAARVLAILDKVLLPDLSKAAAQPAFPFITENTQASPQKPSVESPRPPTPSAATQPERTNGYRALVVDDSVAIQKSLEMNLVTLEQISMVDFADSGEIALEKARAMRYDLIFLDVMMPGIDGYETCSQLRKMAEYKKTPIIMVSGKSSPLDEVKGVIAGCTTYLTKPVQQEAFQKLSRRVLSWLENYQPSAKVSH